MRINKKKNSISKKHSLRRKQKWLKKTLRQKYRKRISSKKYQQKKRKKNRKQSVKKMKSLGGDGEFEELVTAILDLNSDVTLDSWVQQNIDLPGEKKKDLLSIKISNGKFKGLTPLMVAVVNVYTDRSNEMQMANRVEKILTTITGWENCLDVLNIKSSNDAMYDLWKENSALMLAAKFKKHLVVEKILKALIEHFSEGDKSIRDREMLEFLNTTNIYHPTDYPGIKLTPLMAAIANNNLNNKMEDNIIKIAECMLKSLTSPENKISLLLTEQNSTSTISPTQNPVGLAIEKELLNVAHFLLAKIEEEQPKIEEEARKKEEVAEEARKREAAAAAAVEEARKRAAAAAEEARKRKAEAEAPGGGGGASTTPAPATAPAPAPASTTPAPAAPAPASTTPAPAAPAAPAPAPAQVKEQLSSTSTSTSTQYTANI